MDSLTHIVAGACIGELIAGKQLGKKALILGALAQSIPDIDFIASFWLSTTRDLLAHRSFTHSLLFAALISLLLAALSKKWHKHGDISFGKWLFFWGAQLLTHLFLDCFNAYGTGLFEPFSHYRVSFNAIYVADPLFTIWPLIGAATLLILKKSSKNRKPVAAIGIACSGVYLLCSVINKINVDNHIEQSLQAQHINARRYLSTPTPLNNMLWYIVAEDDKGYSIGYRSVFDQQENIDFRYVLRNDSLLGNADDQEDVNRLLRFSEGYYSVQYWHDTLVFNDLRFGEMCAGLLPNPRFSCYYYLKPHADNSMIIQRGRFAKWDKNVLQSYLKRIKGI